MNVYITVYVTERDGAEYITVRATRAEAERDVIAHARKKYPNELAQMNWEPMKDNVSTFGYLANLSGWYELVVMPMNQDSGAVTSNKE